MSEREMVRLEEMCTGESSHLAQKNILGMNGMYPVYGAAGWIADTDFYDQEQEYIAVIKDGAGVGRVMRMPGKSSVLSTLQYIIPAKNVDIGYLYYLLSSMHLQKYVSGATIPHIYFKNYKQVKVPYIPLEEQKKISSRLGMIEKIIKDYLQIVHCLDNLVKSRFFNELEVSA